MWCFAFSRASTFELISSVATALPGAWVTAWCRRMPCCATTCSSSAVYKMYSKGPRTEPYGDSCGRLNLSQLVRYSEIKRDIGQKSQFFVPPTFDAPIRGSPSESSIIYLAVSTQYGRVTNRHTDGQTSCDSIVRAVQYRAVTISACSLS